MKAALVELSPRFSEQCVMGTATPPCPDHAGSAPNTLAGAEVVLFCRMFLRSVVVLGFCVRYSRVVRYSRLGNARPRLCLSQCLANAGVKA